MRPRRLLGASGRPLNFTVRWHVSAERVCLVLLFVTTALFGALRPFLPSGGFPLDALLTVSLIFFWCKFNAQARKVTLPAWNSILIFVAAIIGVPVYFFRTMPRRRAALASLKAAGVLVALVLVASLCSFIARRLAT